MEVLAGVARQHPYTAYAGMKKSFKKEWYLTRSATPSMRETLRINPATMGYISTVILTVKVNRAEEGTGNTRYMLLWF